MQYHDENKMFEVDGIQYPLVEKVRSGSQITLALHEHENALETFKKLLGLDKRILKREGMKSSRDLALLLKKSKSFFKEKLQKCYDENKTFEVEGVQYPLVVKVLSGRKTALALHEDPQAFETFKMLLEEDCSLKREGMKSSVDLVLLFKKGSQFFAKKLKKCYDENRTFKIDGIQYPLTEKVRSAGQQILALHEHPKALETFKQLLVQEGIVLEERKVSPQKQNPLPIQKQQKSR